MKKVILSLIALLFSLTTMALTFTYGSLRCLKGQKSITVSLDLSKTTFKNRKKYTVDDFLSRAYRSKNWKEGSIQQFIKEFNEKTFKVGLRAVDEGKTEFEIQIIPGNIDSNGRFLNVVVNVVKKATGERMASMVLDSDDGDDDDDIAFRDTMGDLGEQLGKFFTSKLKPNKKLKPNNRL